MLGRGNDHKLVPKEEIENVRYRLELREKAEWDLTWQAGIKEICKNDVLFYINTFVWQYNPNAELGHEIGPFVTWDFQDAAALVILDHIVRKRKDLLIEKSREMGATWLLLIIDDWLYRFHPRLKFLCMSRSEELVESEDADSLFWKLDFIDSHLPAWMRVATKRRKKYFGNLDNGSSITGTATTGKAGVGGRATAILLDEFSQNKDDYEVLHRTSDTSKCRIFNGTHLGLDTAFYELSQRPDMDKLVMHWTQHPEKKRGMYRYDGESGKVEVLDTTYCFAPDFRFVMDGSPTGGPFPGIRSPWYDGECIRKGSARAIAMDLDIDPKGSVSQFFDRLMIMTLAGTYSREPEWQGDLHYDKQTARPIALVPVAGGPIKLWMRPDGQGKVPADLYTFGADVATGTGATPSCLSGARARTGEKILEYSNANIFPEKFAALAVALCWLFKNEDGQGALMAWETPGPGLTFGQVVTKELEYRNIYYRTNEFAMHADRGDQPGWHANPPTKKHLLEEYRAALHSRQFLNHSRTALEECLSFAYDKRGEVAHGRASSEQEPSGARLNHADMVIADALCWMMVKKLGARAPVRKIVPPPTVLSLQGRREWHERREREAEYA